MAFKRIPGFKGLVYEPEQQGERKNNCPDCFFCQMCSDERCKVCLKRKCSKCKDIDTAQNGDNS